MIELNIIRKLRTVLILFSLMVAITIAPTKFVLASVETDDLAVHNKTIEIDGLNIFYREAGHEDAPVLLLLHGLSLSSEQYLDLIPKLADKYRVIAPDYPGFGLSPLSKQHTGDYSFSFYAKLMEKFTEALNLNSYAMYVMNNGAPVGYRLAMAKPEKIDALIIQNSNNYSDDVGEFWNVTKTNIYKKPYGNQESLQGFLKIDAIEWQYKNGAPAKNVVLTNPDASLQDQKYLRGINAQEFKMKLHNDYKKNVDLYAKFQTYFYNYQPPTLIVWRAHDVLSINRNAQYNSRNFPTVDDSSFVVSHVPSEIDESKMIEKIHGFLSRSLSY